MTSTLIGVEDAGVTASAPLSARVISAALGQFPPTAEQAAVIESALAPALVVAGAGSGKTETMAGRVVWLVANGIVRRDEVLGLTFTRKAAGELAERIQHRLARLAEFETRGLLGDLPALHASGDLEAFFALQREEDDETDAAARAGRDIRTVALRFAERRRARLDELAERSTGAPVDGADDLLLRPTVATYNSFADQIVRENAVLLGRDSEAAILSESAAWLRMRKVVLDSDDPRLESRSEALSTLIDGALRIARDSVDNLADLDDIAAFPAAFADVLDRPSDSARVSVYADIATAVTKVEGLAVLADLARAYNSEKRRLGVLDFSDQVAGALGVVRAHAAVGEELRSRYRVVLLDEYQDTSVVQTDLLAALFAHTAVMAVGDPHQSIYGWRGASAGNLGGFAAAFAPGATASEFALMTSWRNSRIVLEAANAVLTPLAATSPVPVRELRARPGAPEGELDLVFEADLDAEADRVAAWFASVRARRAASGRSTTGAVLFRSKRHMVRFREALSAAEIPSRILGLGGLLTTPEVVDVVSALRVIHDPGAGSALIRLLSGPRWAIGLADLRALSALAERIARHDFALKPLAPEVAARMRASAGDEQGSLIEALDFVRRHGDDHGWLAAITPEGRMRLREAGTVIAGLRGSVGLPIPELVRLIELELRLDIELAANEMIGSARVASAQLRAFVDEVHAFLATDEAGTIGSLLAWLDHAEQLDEFAPRTEPPEDDVVQLLTIHGSKGLEWDAVAVVRAVEGELPSAARDTKAWLGFGVLPYEFRGDAPWLPAFGWKRAEAATQQALRDNLAAFVAANRARQQEEERRLAYVALTRAKDHLLLSGSSWAGTTQAREPAPYFDEIALALGRDAFEAVAGENPYVGRRRLLEWPLDALGNRRRAVESAAGAVRNALDGPRAEPAPDVALLLAEREALRHPAALDAPTRIPASRFKDYVTDFAATTASISRPMPERPYRQTRLGTLFHAWVEHRSGVVGVAAAPDDPLWELDADEFADDEFAGTDASAEDAAELARLREIFERSEWADLAPIAVETEIDFVLSSESEAARVVICKLDAVYRRDDRGGRIEIVDWKTGRPPRTAAEREERMLQLALYRLAYHRAHGVPLEDIDVALFYVGDDLVIRGDRVYSEAELAQRWMAARAARSASTSSSLASPESSAWSALSGEDA
ncbi:MAG TPA: ATP-dependent DNA helicase [Microbacterium sp.]|uniref:ATP-dependent DNA helicase n=1 Tax=Microbacterium sp. TaxID=51671 RepID=UPI002C2ACAA3|nr:ATP-dependent DNA helicase [Microbacterium sp.]HWI32132.1 ATP-dependent DNA helicase [Microbacterium sp.]